MNVMKTSKRNRLLVEERRRDILAALETEDRVTVEGLAERYGISTVTVRGDLDALASAGALVRSHGGAVKRTDPRVDYPIEFKQTLHQAEKARIAESALRLIRPNQIIILDSGSTTAGIAHCLKASKIRPLTVITNALNIAMELTNINDISVVMLGGMVRPMSYSLVGPQAERTLHTLRADHLFLGVDGIDPEIGITTPDILEAQLNTLMIEVSSETTAVADASKLGRRSLSVIGKAGAIQRLITDTSANEKHLAALRNMGVEVVTV
jgi:DeoR family transcriptional regulator, aga operon transcriptional repressor